MKAFYSKNYSDYEILQTTIDGFLLINDNAISDLVNADIEQFCFNDCIKSYSELLTKNDINILNFGREVEYKKDINTIKILIQGYDENGDNLVFDSSFLTSPYRYSITNNSIEVSINLGKGDAAHDFLASMAYECCVNKINKDKKIFVYINGDLIYDKIYISKNGGMI